MFRRPLRPLFLLLMASFAAAPAAGGTLDVTDVTLVVTIARTTLGQDDIDATLRVEGDGLNSGTITIPVVPSVQLTLDEQAGVLGLDFHFTSEAQLNAALPNGTYTLRVNNSTATATIAYTRPAVPSPAISFPGGGDVVPPGPIEVLFTNCSVCNQIGDSVNAVLEDDLMVELDSETLTSTTESWIPQDIGGDLELPPQSAFLVRVTHQALRQANEDVDGTDDDNTLLFTNEFTQSDEVDFETGFAAPSGHFCLAANHPAPPVGCETLVDPLLQIFDTSGMVSTTVAGLDVDYVVTVGEGGELTGTATADLDDNGSNETGPNSIKGKLKGGDGDVGSKLSFSLANEGLDAKLKVSVTDELSILGNQLDRSQRASGAIGDTKIKEDVTTSGVLPIPPLGWLLEFDLDSSAQVSNAVLTLEGGRTFPLTGTNKFNFASNVSSMKLSSAQKGVSVSFKGLGVDDTSDPLGITEGDLSYRALGQSGRAELP